MTRSSLRPLALLLTTASLGLTACGDPPPPSEVRSRLATDLSYVLREAAAAAEATARAVPGGAALGALDRALAATGLADDGLALRARAAVAGLARGADRAAARPTDPAGTDPLVTLLTERLFTDESYLGDGIYAVPPELVCAESPLAAAPAVDPQCAADLAKAELRVRVSGDRDELRFAIQLGADRDEPLTIGLERAAVSLTVDLDDAIRAAAALARAFGEELPNAALSGQLTGRLAITGPARVTATLDVERPIAIALAEAGAPLDGPDAIRLRSAKARVLAIDLDGAAERGSFALGLGATSAHLVAGSGSSRERLELDLPALRGTAAIAPGEPLRLSGISLGDRAITVKRNGALGLAIELNPEHGRTLAATITADPSGRDTIAVSPRLDLRLATDHAVLGDPAPVYDVTRIVVEGTLRADDARDQLEVLAGQLQLVASPASYGVAATAGQCVRSAAAITPAGQPYTRWTAGACL